MKKIILFVSSLALFSQMSFAQEVAQRFKSYAQNDASVPSQVEPKEEKPVSSWKKKTEFGLNFNQGSFNSNWTGGGVGSVAFSGFFNSKGEYKKDRTEWVNDLQLQYGLVSNIGQSQRKSIDRIFFDSKLGRTLNDKWSMYASFNFLTQFGPGYTYGKNSANAETTTLISNLFAPAYMTEALGFEYKPKPYFNVQIAPVSMRQTIVSDTELYKTFPKNYGVEVGKTLRNQVGILQVVANFDKEIAKNIGLKFRYQMFASYENPAAIANRLDLQVAAKLNKYMNMTFGTIMIYDQDQIAQLQIAQQFGLGFLYTF
jgi:Protein of unknown function (DUF3078)